MFDRLQRLAIPVTFTVLSSFVVAPVSFAVRQPQLSHAPSHPTRDNLMAQSLPLAGLITELETNIKWSAVQDKWRNRRSNWLSDVKETTDPASLAELLVELERNIKWSAVEGRWRGRRDSWVRKCQQARTSSQLSVMLIELERNIKWSAVEGRWRERRDRWVSEVRASG